MATDCIQHNTTSRGLYISVQDGMKRTAWLTLQESALWQTT